MRSRKARRGGAKAWLLLLTVAAAAQVSGLIAPASSVATLEKGSAEADSLAGTPRADTLLGLGGDDRLGGRGGPDRLVGGPGSDWLSGGVGADQLLGGSGKDRLLARDGRADRLNCGAGDRDSAVVDAVDQVSATCERVEGGPEEQPSASGSPGGSTASQTAPAPGPNSGGTSDDVPPLEEELEVEFEETPLAMFPAGHGWTGNGVGTFGDAGPPFVVNNDRSFRITTNGNGDESVASSPPLEPVDLSRSHVSVHAEVSFSAHLGAVKLRLASGNIQTDYAEATVWEKGLDPVILGSTFEFQSLPVGSFEIVGDVDWSEIDRAQIALTDNEAGSVTLYTAGIYGVPTQHRATISFAFDDGHESIYTRALRKLSSYRFPASAYVIADSVGDANVMDLEQLSTLRKQNHWEIGGHAFALASHNLPNGLDSLEPAALTAEMDDLRGWLDEHGFSRETFAYPKGAAGPAVRDLVERDYCAGRVTARGPETIPTRDNYTIRGWSINGEETGVEDIEAAIDRAVAQGTWLILSFHDIVAGEAQLPTEFADQDFSEVVDYVRERQGDGALSVRTVAAALGRHC